MKLYTKTVCPKCIWAKSEIKQHDLAIEIVNIDQDEHAYNKLVNAGIMGVPVLEINEDFITDPKDISTQIEQLKTQ